MKGLVLKYEGAEVSILPDGEKLVVDVKKPDGDVGAEKFGDGEILKMLLELALKLAPLLIAI